MLIALAAATAVAATSLSPVRIKEDVRVLSSDAFGGRGPGEPGEGKTIAYLANAMAAAGFAPGGEQGGWTQNVPLVRLDRLPGATMMLSFGGALHPLTLGRDATLALRFEGRTGIDDAPLIFAGFGVVDPKRGWDAYAGVDMAGKVAVVLANDPDFEGGRDLGFDGRRMALAGRFGSKVEAAARAGAAAVLVIHEEAAASYPFSRLGPGRDDEGIGLARPRNGARPAARRRPRPRGAQGACPVIRLPRFRASGDLVVRRFAESHSHHQPQRHRPSGRSVESG
jgi:hypothetical protein